MSQSLPATLPSPSRPCADHVWPPLPPEVRPTPATIPPLYPASLSSPYPAYFPLPSSGHVSSHVSDHVSMLDLEIDMINNAPCIVDVDAIEENEIEESKLQKFRDSARSIKVTNEEEEFFTSMNNTMNSLNSSKFLNDKQMERGIILMENNTVDGVLALAKVKI